MLQAMAVDVGTVPSPLMAVGMGVAAAHKAVGGAATTGCFSTAWFIILLFTTSMGLVAAAPRSPAMKLALCEQRREKSVRLATFVSFVSQQWQQSLRQTAIFCEIYNRKVCNL